VIKYRWTAKRIKPDKQNNEYYAHKLNFSMEKTGMLYAGHFHLSVTNELNKCETKGHFKHSTGLHK
jgi:hypothetical protein